MRTALACRADGEAMASATAAMNADHGVGSGAQQTTAWSVGLPNHSLQTARERPCRRSCGERFGYGRS
jgi:hypothetical protein